MSLGAEAGVGYRFYSVRQAAAAIGERKFRMPPLALLLASMLILGCDVHESPDAAKRPNIVVILADDLGWRDTGVYGNRFFETPNIDSLASSGMRFTDAYAASPLCSPTRASLITGLDPGRLRFTLPIGHLAEVVLDPVMPAAGPSDERAVSATSRTRLPLEYRTTAESLAESGYATAFFGKWQLGSEPYSAAERGFDHVMPGGSYHSPPSSLSPFGIPGFDDGTPGEHIDERLAKEAVSFIRQNREQPFFVSFWMFSVHRPYMAKPELVRKYQRKADSRRVQRFAPMGAMIETMDDSVGTILSAIDELGLTNDTLVIFTSDNGGVDWQFNPGSRLPVPTDNAPLRGGKGQLHEGGIRVPLIVRWPGKVEAGSVSNEIVQTTDLHPTLLELARSDPESQDQLDGVSIVAALEGRPLAREAIFLHFPHYMLLNLSPPGTVVRRGNWKLIRYYADADDQQNRLELYNLKADIAEQHDVASRRPRVTAKLNALIDRYLLATSAMVPFANLDYVAAEKAEAEKVGAESVSE